MCSAVLYKTHGQVLILSRRAAVAGADAVSTLRETIVRTGASVTIPCHYEDKHKSRVKTWLLYDKWRKFNTLIRTDSPITDSDKVSISDDPAQGVFTVTMRGLETGDTGHYYCAVETEGPRTRDDRAYLHITVTADPIPYRFWLQYHQDPMMQRLGSVKRSGLRNHSWTDSKQDRPGAGPSEEQGPFQQQLHTLKQGITVKTTAQRPARLGIQTKLLQSRSSQKQWCRSGDWSSCQTAGSPGTAGHGSALITDHTAEGLFSVTVSGLRLEDQGWYWCVIGNQQLPVYLIVTNAETTATPATTSQQTFSAVHTAPPTGQSSSLPSEDKDNGGEGGEKHNANSGEILHGLLIACGLVLLLGAAVIVTWKMWRRKKERRRNKEEADQGQNNFTASTLPASDVLYAVVSFQKKALQQEEVPLILFSSGKHLREIKMKSITILCQNEKIIR
ncbi:polymeric immunoglobulin receptor [Amia ocellicauda]|uniref:polymeric immunoglobulin receptor n=1 Tax=Amia ocellicauda TaxID=2972642 RepID=UPI003464A23F